ncbi:ribosomal protein S18-alanine N-acetyltransferase [Phosphitispora fastidiosa]|uniref:ribosomal protein S18-alanine N-acetyltransferase n=1 Tax=Phosphitispora fastidiosa TaxID=2837202 RepID=UPI001E374DEC|nr:ribosomal protein S18-alanine N-acetyltransferase [Phosphitispora fastidiosa]MBU7008440.1 ribosomal-protein-alanine N-acetyltransferase [Phosphitispora fastidiosa]
MDNTKTPVRIKRMCKAYLDEVVAIENTSFPTPWSRMAFSHEIDNNDFAYYIAALAGDRVIGYAGMWIILDEGHVTTLAVHPSYRRKQVGGTLLCELFKEALCRGCQKMTLEVRPSNFAALRLYENTGFISHGVRHGYYSDTGEDAVIMWKNLRKDT